MKTFARRLLAGMFSCALIACTPIIPNPDNDPGIRLYNATAAYGSSLKFVLIYESLPRCAVAMTAAAAASSLCSQATAVASIRDGDNLTFAALEIAGAGIPVTPALEALRALIAVDRARLHSDVS